MRFAVSAANIGDPAALVSLGVHAEEAGWDAFFLWDHLQFWRTANVDVVDPWVVLGAVAHATDAIRLGAMVTPLPRRRPWKLAKELVTLDHLSNGRLVVGLGLGSPPDDDFAAFGDPADARLRAALLDEGLVLLDRFLRGEPVVHRGDHFDVDAHLRPGARQRPRPPIWLAAMWPNRAPVRRAQDWDGVVPIGVDGEPLLPDDVAEVCALVGAPRPGFDVVVTARDDVPTAEYADAGATWVIVSQWPRGDWITDLEKSVAAGPS